jgi:iron complex outermembrane receptor protein
MLPRIVRYLLTGVVPLALSSASALAQTGSITGRVTDRQSGSPIAAAQVRVVTAGGGTAGSVATTGTYSVEMRFIGFASATISNVVVTAGGTTTADAALTATVIELDPLVVAVGRREEKAIDAPASVSVVPRVTVSERAALSAADHMKSVPGVDVSQGGLVQSNVVGRGFNNIFSGALLTLIDNRYASVPSLRVNVPAFFSNTNDDIEKIEFVLGPGAALYGPNSSNGVMAITTKSPFTARGGTIWLETGLRSASRTSSEAAFAPAGFTAGQKLDDARGLWRVGARYAAAADRVGFKVSGEYLRGTEWRMVDPAEPKDLPGRPCDPEFACRDFQLTTWKLDGRLDFRPNENSEIILAAGRNYADKLIEYTGIGAAQALDWSYTFAQLRARVGRFFLQGFGNFSDSGNDEPAPGQPTEFVGSYLFRDGNPIVDKSRLWAAQAQHGFTAANELLDVIYGADFTFTDARTGGTINGRNEDDDSITEIGGYAHATVSPNPYVDLVAALRVDDHSEVDDPQWSPRAAIVLKPSDNQNIRFTYNHAFSTPSNNNLYLDIVAGMAGPYNVRALGTARGFEFRAGHCDAGGLDGLCMRSPEAFGVPQVALPAHAAPLWAVAVGAVSPALIQAGVPAQIMQLLGAQTPTPQQVGTQLRRLNPTTGTFADIETSQVSDIARVQPTLSDVLEIGYKGIIGGKFRLAADVWFEWKKDFVGPLIVESPNVFLDPTSTAQYIGGVLTAAGLPPAQIAALTPVITGAMAGIPNDAQLPGVPLGTVVPSSDLTQSSDIFLTYRNFGKVNLWGADLAFDYLISNRFGIAATYSFVNDDFFPSCTTDPGASDCIEGPSDIALNATTNKASFTLRYRDEPLGLSAEGRIRYAKGFPVNSGVYVSPQDASGNFIPLKDWNPIDVQVAYRMPFARGAMATLTVDNLFNQNYATFVGVPQLGRLIMLKLQWGFLN